MEQVKDNWCITKSFGICSGRTVCAEKNMYPLYVLYKVIEACTRNTTCESPIEAVCHPDTKDGEATEEGDEILVHVGQDI
eukprot:424101-Ditylum_brightwellii.AAC.1